MNRNTSSVVLLLTSVLLLSGCNLFGSGASDSGTASSSSLSSSSEDTAPSSVFLQGTVTLADGPLLSVQLVTPVGSTYTLLSSSIPLSTYAGNEVEVSGILSRDTETGEQLLQVDQITIVVSSSVASSESSSMSSTESSVSSSAMSSLMSSVMSSAKPVPKSSSSSLATVSSSSAAAASSSVASLSEDVKKMARVKGEESWTQKYCSSHIGVCFPVRSDFWYKSFGATATSSWHVELAAHDLQEIGEGSISVDLINARIPDGASDGAFVVEGGVVKGYRVWTGNKHFVVTAPVELRASVEFLVNHILPYEVTPAQ